MLDIAGSFRAITAAITGTFTAQSAIINGDATFAGAITAGSANITGAFTANGATITGALSAQSATIPTITGNTTVTGTLTANALNVQSARIDGTLCTKEVQVAATPCWPDFVFEEDYNLPSLSELEQFIKQNNHLPEIPSAQEVEANGINLGDMQSKLIQKIEELTLYILQQDKKITDLQNQMNELKKQ
jgi:cytoskeletal protein CcmA (bactofilin family)